jgi:hypothetical protein
MTGFVGADVEQLDALAVRLDRQAAAYREIATSSTVALMMAGWTGADIDRVRSEWNRQSKPAILRVAAELASLAVDVRRQEQQQRATSAAYTGNSRISSYARSTADVVRAVRDARDKDIVQITEVVGDDGVTRYIVTIDGTHGDIDDWRSWMRLHGWNEAVLNAMDLDTFSKVYVEARLREATKDHPDAEIMMIGYSQGGDVAQGIANDAKFNVKEILTIGSPPVMTTNHYGGANIVRLAHNSDEVLNSVQIVRDAAARDGMVMGAAAGAGVPLVGAGVGAVVGAAAQINSIATAMTSGDRSDGSVLTFRGGSAQEAGGAHEIGHADDTAYHGHYEYLATSYDESTEPAVVAARERQAVFFHGRPVQR